MAGLCTIYGTVITPPGADALRALAPGAEVAPEEAPGASNGEGGAPGGARMRVRWPDGLTVLVTWLAPGDAVFSAQVRAMAGFVLQAAGGATPAAYRLLQKVLGAWHVVGVASGGGGGAPPSPPPPPAAGPPEPEPEPRWDARVEALVGGLAGALAGVVFRAGRLEDPSLRLLLARDGAADPAAVLPELPSALERRRRSEERMRAAGIEVEPDLPPLPGDEEVRLREADEVARRAQALWAVVARATVLEREEAVALLQRRGLWAAASPAEQELLLEAELDEATRRRMREQADALWLLLWALGRVERLEAPSKPCDPERATAILRRTSAEDFIRGATLRPVAEILDEADPSYRLHWAVAEASRRGAPPPAGVDPAVVRERHLATSWLIRHMSQPWDALAAAGT